MNEDENVKQAREALMRELIGDDLSEPFVLVWEPNDPGEVEHKVRMIKNLEKMQDRLGRARDSIVRLRDRLRTVRGERDAFKAQVAALEEQVTRAEEREQAYLKAFRELRG